MYWASMPQAGSLRYHDDCVGENVGKYKVSLTRPLLPVSFCISAFLSLKVAAILYFYKTSLISFTIQTPKVGGGNLSKKYFFLPCYAKIRTGLYCIHSSGVK